MTVQKVSFGHPEIDALTKLLHTKLAAVFHMRLIAKGARPLPAREIARRVERNILGLEEDFCLVTAGPCVVAYNVYRPWWAAGPVLAEEFIVRYKPGNFADTIRAMEQHAQDCGCTDLVISSLAMIRQESYGNYLKRKGFTESARQYIKEVT